MAHGIGGSRRDEAALGGAFRLEYDGRLGKDDILDGPQADLKSLMHVPGDPVNRLVHGDNLPALRALMNDGDIAGNVRLVYIDPPYATRSRFESDTAEFAYDDIVYGAEYIEFMRQRLVLLRELLADDGSIYVHLDHNMIFPIKIVMDEVFGATNFRNAITRIKCNPKNFTRRQYGDVADYVLFYSKTANYVWNQPYDPWGEGEGEREYIYTEEDTGRRYKRVPCHAPGRRNGETGGLWKGMLPPTGKHWVLTPAKLDELDAQGRIHWSRTGNPRRKIYLDESPGRRISNVWTQFRDSQNQNMRVTGYPTEKNGAMLDMIVAASSNAGDLVLDAFAGSGATLAAAEAAGRQWVGIDSSISALRTIMHRLLHGTARMGAHSDRYNRDHLGDGRGLRGGLELLLDCDFTGELPTSQEVDQWQRAFMG